MTYRCDHCGKEFKVDDPDWDDKAALKESRETFGFIPPPHERAVLCDECWDEMLAWARGQGLTVRP